MAHTTSLLAKYLGLYEKNPTGLVFAPLAETYRKLSMHKEALEVLKKGLRHHPHYALGLIVLGHCYFDQGNLEQSYKVLAPLANQEFDNLMLQKLFAQVCYKMYAYKESLQAFKHVLYVNPHDQEAINRVKELEEQEQTFSKYMAQSENLLSNSTNNPIAQEPTSVDDTHAWKSLENQQQVPLPIPSVEEKKVADYLKDINEEHVDAWSVKQWSVNDDKVAAKPEEAPLPIQPQESNPSINLDSYQNLSPTEEVPIVTHTLIDIFCSQKHYDKAKELLEKVLKNDPNDVRSKQKYEQVLERIRESSSSPKVAKATPKKLKHTWDDSKYTMLSQKYGKLLNHLKDIGKSH